MSISYEESDYPIAISPEGIVYFHEKIYDPERLDHEKYNITEEEAEQVEMMLKSKANTPFSGKLLKYYLDCKDEFRNMKNRTLVYQPQSKMDRLTRSESSSSSSSRPSGEIAKGFEPIPKEIKNQREDINVTGPSGSGKSTFISKYAAKYHKLFPKNGIYLFSKKNEDEVFDDKKYIKRVALNEKAIEDLQSLTVDDLKDTFLIFDDIETLKPKELNVTVHKLLDEIQMTGRSANITVAILNHIVMAGPRTKTTLSESSALCLFQDASAKHRKSVLSTYVGLDRDQIDDIEDMLKTSRWIFVHRNRPKYAISENKIILL